MKDKCYAVSLEVNGDGNILTGSCECPRGNWICSHMAATAIYANKRGLSKLTFQIHGLQDQRKRQNKTGKL